MRGVEASESIVASNGTKLVAKGARIDASLRDRLLQHKLAKPLEQCVQVVDAVGSERLREVAGELTERHALLRALDANERAGSLPDALANLKLTPPLQSLLSVYVDSQDSRLAHTVGVAMLTLGLARRLWPGEGERHRTLAVAGLVHDAGELYIDPAFLRPQSELRPEQWRHVVSHPAVAHKVLADMAGAGPAVAVPVLLHHERLDGFGYPRGVADEQFTLEGQVLAVAEWLMALLESGFAPLTRASLARQLMPGEFGDAVLDIVAAAARAGLKMAPETVPPVTVEDALPRVERIAAMLARQRELLPWLDEEIGRVAPALRAVLQASRRRMQRMQASFSSLGFDAKQAAELLAEWAALDNADSVHREVATLLRELSWRMREMERETWLRAWLLPPDDGAVVSQLMARLRGEPAAAAPATVK